MKHILRIVIALLFAPFSESLACGGLFCDQGTVAIPPAQSSERIIFVIHADAEGAVVDAGLDAPDASVPDAAVGDAGTPRFSTVDIYVEIGYSGAAESFAWVVPLLAPPISIDTAPTAIFDDLDAATAPRFTFAYAGATVAQADGGGGCGWGGSSESADSGDAEAVADPEVTVLSTERVGPYEVAVIQSTGAGDLRAWLLANGYRIPASAEPLLAAYVAEGKTFAAFRLADGKGVGAIQPVVIRQPGVEPCIPLRLTPVASEPVLSVSALVIGAGRAVPINYESVEVDPDDVRPTSPTTSDYPLLLRAAARASGGRAFATEFAGWTRNVEATTDAARAILGKGDFVTRLSTRIAPGEMTADPIFVHTTSTDEVSRDHVVDVTDDPAALDALQVSVSIDSGGSSSSCASAGRARGPGLSILLLFAAFLLRHRRT
jgi:hypothetical protein